LVVSKSHTALAYNILYQNNFENYSDGTFPSEWFSDHPSADYWGIFQNKLVANLPQNIAYSRLIYNSSWSNYIINLKVKGISGVDRFILFRTDYTRGFGKESYYFKYTESNYGFSSFVEIGKGSLGKIQSCIPITEFYSSNGSEHNFQIELLENRIKIFEIVNNSKIPIFDCQDADPLLTGGFGFFNQPNGIGINLPTVYEVDDINIFSPNEDLLLNVPDIKQYNPKWKDEIYDHANDWSPEKPSIERWGCALTSVSMILQYYGFNLDPSTLNSWLIVQKDGYIKNGLLNWLAISRYTKIQNLIDPSLPVLEFEMFDSNSQILADELKTKPKGNPVILKILNHFLVIKGITDNDYFINDPSSQKELLSQVSSNYLSIIRYLPSFTDLSYMMLIYDSDLNISVKSPNSDTFPNKNYIEVSPHDSVDNMSLPNHATRIFLLPKPIKGNYEITLSKKGIYTIESYAYNENGEFVLDKIEGVSFNKPQNIIYTYGGTNNLSKNVDIDKIIEELFSAKESNLIYKDQIYREIINQLKIIKIFIEYKRIKQAVLLLKMVDKKIEVFSKHFLDDKVAEIIHKDIEELIKSL
jgi:hypothetical protein